jgi:uncharacterized spore protein YtfJ
MTTTLDEAMFDAQSAAAGAMHGMVERLAERFGGAANASAVFGQPIEKDGLTIIPVARVRWGVGAGGGAGVTSKHGGNDVGEGGGGGGGVAATPLGYIEMRDGTARFVRFRDPGAIVPLLLAGAASTWLVLRALRSLFR